MAMPSTGALGILSCPNGACSNIGGVVCGALSGPISLKCMLNIATLGSNMSNFHGSPYGDLVVSPTPVTNISNAGATCSENASSYSPNTFTVATACSWLHPASPTAPSIGGTSQSVVIDANAGAARSGVVCYTPSHCGTRQDITFCQLAGITWKCIDVGTCTTVGCGSSKNACQCALLTCTPTMVAGDCYCLCATYNGTYGNSAGSYAWLCITRAGASILSCCITTTCASSSLSFTVCYGQAIGFCIVAFRGTGIPARGNISISCITSIVGNECKGSGGSNVCIYTA